MLEQGRLQLQVAPSNKALQLRAGDSTIRDIGTTFQVERLRDGLVEVALLEGAVEVSSGAAQHAGARPAAAGSAFRPYPARPCPLPTAAAEAGCRRGNWCSMPPPVDRGRTQTRYGRTPLVIADPEIASLAVERYLSVPAMRRAAAVGAGTGVVRGWPDASGWRAGTAPHVLRRTGGEGRSGCAAVGLLRALLCLALGVAAVPMADAGTRGHAGASTGAGPLVPALQQWARQSGTALLFDARELGVCAPMAPVASDTGASLKQLVAGLPVNILRTSSGAFCRAAGPCRACQAAGAFTALRLPRRPPPRSADTPHEVELAPIHVTGSRLPRSSVQTTLPVTTIDRDDIPRSGYGNLFDLLRHLPGMNGHPAMSTRAAAIRSTCRWVQRPPPASMAWDRGRRCSWSMAGACRAIRWCRWNRVG